MPRVVDKTGTMNPRIIKDCERLYNDISVLIDGENSFVVMNVLSSLTVNLAIDDDFDKEKFLSAMDKLFDLCKDAMSKEVKNVPM
jgi:hypothetical protein